MFRAVVATTFIILFSGSALALTLEEAVATGLKNNYEMQAFRFEEDAARGQMRKAELPPFSNPVIEGGFSYKERPPLEPGGKFRNNQISISQSVEIGGQRRLRIEAATSNLERTYLEVQDTERTLRADIKDGFAQALFLRDREALTREYLLLQSELSDLVFVKFQAGDVAALEVNLSQVELARAQREVIAASTEYGNGLISLGRLIGLPAESAVDVEGALATELPPLPERETLLARVAGRPDVKAAEVETKRAQALERLVVREAIPNLTWTLFQGKDEEQYERGGGLGISIPLFDRKEGERAEAKARLSQTRTRAVGVKRMVQKEIEESYAAAASSLRQIGLFKQAILGRTTENLELLQLAFKEGKISFYDVRVAQRETLDTRNAYLQALLTAQRSYNALERAVGGELR